MAAQCGCAVPTSDKFCSQTCFFIWSWHCAAAFCLQNSKLCTDLDLSFFYILFVTTYTKFGWENKMPLLGVCLPQPQAARVLAAGCRVKITFTLWPTNCFVSTTTNSIKCVVNWNPLRFRVRSRNTQPHLKVGLVISRTNALTDSQWNPVYKAFHRIFSCGNDTIRRLFCKRDLDAANLRPALEQGCGKQTPGARHLFSRANVLYVPHVKM